MFGIEKNKTDIRNLKEDYDALFRRVFNGFDRTDPLFAKDRHGMMRPKVDLLYESFDKTATDIFVAINKLSKRMEKLEKK